MKNLTDILDRVATELESRGLIKLAAEVDIVANTIDARVWKGTGKHTDGKPLDDKRYQSETLEQLQSSVDNDDWEGYLPVNWTPRVGENQKEDEAKLSLLANTLARDLKVYPDSLELLMAWDTDKLPKIVKEAAWEGLSKGVSSLAKLTRYGATAVFAHALFGSDKPKLIAALTHLITSGQDPYLAVDVAQSMLDTSELSEEFIAAVKAKLASSPDIMKHHLYNQDLRKIVGVPVE